MPKPKTDQKTLLGAAVGVPLIIIFTSQLLDMSLGMALILGVLILLRVLFADNRPITIAIMIAILLWAIYMPLAHDEKLRDEHGIEMYYNVAITPWCQLTPDLQVITPFRDRAETALLLGVRANVEF